jgi:regulator of protease activity HflC (stomatin/prohibitin superfamily)
VLIASAGILATEVIVGVVVVGGVALFLKSAVKVIQQGSVGVVKRLGEFRSIRQPGLAVLRPFVDQMVKVDMREFPQVGDQQAVITKDNVSVMVSATIFCQVIDVKSALFEINDFLLAIDQLSKTALRAVFGELSLDESLSQREQINTRMQDHMADATMKWGVRLNRIEILDIRPPNNVLQAMSEQKEAEQHKRAAILKSEGDQQAAINTAQGQKQAEVLKAEGAKQSAILAAEAQKQSLQLRAEGEKVATQLRGEGEAALLSAIDSVAIRQNTLAVLQLRALQDVATAPTSKLVVPYEAAGLIGTAAALVEGLSNRDVDAPTIVAARPPAADGTNSNATTGAPS